MGFSAVGLLLQASTVEPAVWHERQQQQSSSGQHAKHPIHDKVKARLSSYGCSSKTEWCRGSAPGHALCAPPAQL